MVSPLNPVNIAEEQFQRQEQTTATPLQPIAKQIPWETKGCGSNSYPSKAKTLLEERCSFSSSPLELISGQSAIKERLLRIALSPANIVLNVF